MRCAERARRDEAIVREVGLGMSLDEAAFVWGLSRSRVHQIVVRDTGRGVPRYISVSVECPVCGPVEHRHYIRGLTGHNPKA